MTVYDNTKRSVFKEFNTIWSLLTEESRPPEESSYLRNIKKTYQHLNDVLSPFLLLYELVI